MFAQLPTSDATGVRTETFEQVVLLKVGGQCAVVGGVEGREVKDTGIRYEAIKQKSWLVAWPVSDE